MKRLPVIAGSLFFWSLGMRALILIVGSALALAACRNSDQSANTVNADQGLTADSITSNDVTAIDAVTGADANMAADLNYIPGVSNTTGGNGSAPASSGSRPTRPSSGGSNSATSSTAPQTAPATQNTTANVAGNSAL